MQKTALTLAALVLMMTSVLAAEGKKTETSVKFYGYVKVDVAYDNARSSHGNFIMFVQPYLKGNKTNTLNFTARQTRLGMNLTRGDTKGKVEVDFYGSGDKENKNHLMLRHAYVDFPVGEATLRAGQTSDIISPLVPATLNYSVGWGCGNIGYRRAQIRLFGKNDAMNWAFGIARSIGGDLNTDGVNDGDDGDFPTVQGRIGFGAGKMALGLSGHYGRLRAPGTAEPTYASWSGNIDGKVTLSQMVSFLFEAYMGENTGTYFGAMLNGDDVNGLKSRGGWANIQLNPEGPAAFSIGGGIDDLNDEFSTYIATKTKARTRNAFLFGNFTYAVQNNVETGIEVTYWETRYINTPANGASKAKDLRLQWSIQGTF